MPQTDDTHDTLPQVDVTQDAPPQVELGDASGFTISDALRAILPDNWDAGVDRLGKNELFTLMSFLLNISLLLGAVPSEQAQNTLFRFPWKFSNQAIRSMTRLTKVEYFQFVESSIGSRQRAGVLSLWAESLLFLMKVAHNTPYELLGTMFEVSTKVAHDAVYRQLLHHYFHNLNIPQIVRQDGSINEEELDKMFRTADRNTEPFYKTFEFKDPQNRGRRGVFFNIDATYFFTEGSSDIELQKSTFYAPKSNHVVKWLTITDLSGKVLGICPASTSATPASGDRNIAAMWIFFDENSDSGKYLKTFLRGNDEFFPVLITDAGFVVEVPNNPRVVRDVPTLVTVCEESGGILLHTSNRYHTYHLEEDQDGLLSKLEPREENCPTRDEATVKFSRVLRKPQEMSFGVQKNMFKMLGTKIIANSLVQPLTSTQMQRLNVPQHFSNVPKITYFATVICSIYNLIHPGFKLLFFDTAEHQIEAGERMKTRMKVENPLLHNVFDINFQSQARGPWTDSSFADFSGQQNILNIPRLTLDEVNPKAVQLCSGPHAIQRAHSVLTYVAQLHCHDNNINGQERENIIQTFPSFHKVQHLRVTTPPDSWDPEKFGAFQPLTLVRTRMPPSNRSVSSPANFHWCVIGFGDQGTDRLALIPPMDRILYYYCFSCPALNALCSCCRHLAAGFMGLCFQDLFKSTAKNFHLLNPVASQARQCLISLPMTETSRDIPEQNVRRSRDTRQSDINPLYVYGDLPQQRSRSVPARGALVRTSTVRGTPATAVTARGPAGRSRSARVQARGAPNSGVTGGGSVRGSGASRSPVRGRGTSRGRMGSASRGSGRGGPASGRTATGTSGQAPGNINKSRTLLMKFESVGNLKKHLM